MGLKTRDATAHYVTADLDAGPIARRDVAHVSHHDTINELVRVGREVECRVLARAVRWHLEDRALVDGGALLSSSETNSRANGYRARLCLAG